MSRPKCVLSATKLGRRTKRWKTQNGEQLKIQDELKENQVDCEMATGKRQKKEMQVPQ